MKIGLFTDALADRTLPEVLDWLRTEVPEVTQIEIGTGAYSPARHVDMALLLADAVARRRTHKLVRCA